MNKTYIYMAAAGALLVLVGGAYVLVGRSKAPEVVTPTSTASSTTTTPAPAVPVVVAVEVDYTGQGFTPATVTVKKGMTVKFVNKTDGPMDVASNPHPTHTNYPEFDQKQGGGEYTFTFIRVGTWRYHNHLDSSDGGTVVVTE